MDYKKVGLEILDLVGGKENIDRLYETVTPVIVANTADYSEVTGINLFAELGLKAYRF